MGNQILRSFIGSIVIVAMLLGFSAPSLAQPIPAGEEKTKPSISGPRRQLATILFTGLGGAVLGLSTLSFYGRPQDKLSNIAIGFAFGVIVGTGFVTYRAATNPSELYGATPLIEKELAMRHDLTAPSEAPVQFSYSWNF